MTGKIDALTADLLFIGGAQMLSGKIFENNVARRIAALPFCLTVAVMAVADIVVGSVANIFVLMSNIACLEGKELRNSLIALVARPFVAALVTAVAVIAAPILFGACVASDAVALKFFDMLKQKKRGQNPV